MSILVISDLHFEKKSFRGIYQGGALDWLLKIIDKTKPTTLVGLGDWGSAWTREDWNLLTQKVTLLGLYTVLPENIAEIYIIVTDWRF